MATTKKTTRTTKKKSESCPISSICQNKVPCILKRGALVASVASLAFSLYLWFSGLPTEAIYVGLWVPTILLLGNYCDLCKNSK